MIIFEHIIADPLGIHARPAAMLVKAASSYDAAISIRFGIKEFSAKKMIALMSLGLKRGDQIEIRIEGEDEIEAAQNMKTTLKAQL